MNKRFDGLCSLMFLYISETDLQHNILLGGYPLFYYGNHMLAVIYK